VPDPLKLSAPATGGFWEIPVLFEDEHLLALDKPASLASTPDRENPDRPCLMRLLHDAIAARKPWAASRGLSYLMHAQRLDAETTGVLLLAKSRPVLIQLANQFSTSKPLQSWLALVRGTPPQERLEINARLAPDGRRPGLMRTAPEGMEARTLVELAEAFAGVSLLRCQLITARTHQLRVHLRHVRLPVFGDRLYACHSLLLSNLKPGYRLKHGHTEKPLLGRAAVHAERLELAHPVTGTPLSISAPWPRDLQVALKYLRRFAPVGGPIPATEEPLSGEE
jgi:RluA family pseudouridine synthase